MAILGGEPRGRWTQTEARCSAGVRWREVKPLPCPRNIASLAFQPVPRLIAKALSGLISFVFSHVPFLSPEGDFDG